MSRIDATFGRLAPKLIDKWQSNSLSLVRSGRATYNKDTGVIVQREASTSVKGVVLNAMASEYKGVAQEGDVKILLDPGSIAKREDLTTADRFRYRIDNRVREAKVVEIRKVQGDKTLFYSVLARPQ